MVVSVAMGAAPATLAVLYLWHKIFVVFTAVIAVIGVVLLFAVTVSGLNGFT